jgi:hypothetical protein
MDNQNAMYLSLVAAKAKQLASDIERNKLWEGDLKKGVVEIKEQLEKVAL